MAAALYERIQRGKLIWLAFVFVAVEAVILTAVRDELTAPLLITVLAAGGLVVAVILIASTLTVSVTAEEIVLRFGWGWPQKRIRRTDVLAHRAVRNHWMLGWGLRWFPGGTMWNVWGRDAIELELASGRKFRIGTDDVPGLTAVLESR